MIGTVEGRLMGVFPALPVPLHDDKTLDLEGLGRIIDRVIDRGVPGISVLGGGGEAVYLTGEERQQVVGFAAERIARRALLFAGVVELPTAVAVYEATRFRELGADVLLVAPPLDDALPQVINHYSAVARDAGLPILYDHDPKRTHVELTPEDMGKLFVEVALVGIRNGASSAADAIELIHGVGRPIAMFAGQSTDCLACLEGGGVGAICPLAVILPTTARRLVDEYRAGSTEAAKVALSWLLDATAVVLPELGKLNSNGIFHAGIKEVLVSAGIIESVATRDPGPPPSDLWRQRIREIAKDLLEL